MRPAASTREMQLIGGLADVIVLCVDLAGLVQSHRGRSSEVFERLRVPALDQRSPSILGTTRP